MVILQLLDKPSAEIFVLIPVSCRLQLARVKKNEALQTKQMKLFERMNMLKKAYYASDASLPLKTQLELFMKEDIPD